MGGGGVIVDERKETWCRVRTGNKVVDQGMERMIENENRLRMVQDERIERTPFGWEMEMVIVDESMESWR